MHTMPPTVRVESVVTSRTTLTVGFSDGSTARCNRFWLRDNCPSNGDRASLFRPFSVASMDEGLTIDTAEVVDGELSVAFSDGTVDRFPAGLLFEARPVTGDEAVASQAWRAWRSGDEPTVCSFDDVAGDGAAHHALLEAVAGAGVAVITGIPDAPASTEVMAAWLGPIRETDFGRVFDIVTEPDPFTPSQSDTALDPHTDDPYRYSPAGISILHCVMPCSGEGGESSIVDGLAAAEAVAAADPDGFRMLTEVAVPYIHRREQAVDQGDDVHLCAEAPVVALDASGRICGIRFHERSMATIRLDADDAERFYRALSRFARLVRGDEFTYRRRLEAGEAFVYDNQRVLHGRSAITGARSRRHLRLCTVDRDQVHSRLRRSRAMHAPGTEHLPLPAGSLS
jgi:gamma-butyrobetaine dioxygenase